MDADRFTARFAMHHESAGEEPVSVSSEFSYMLQNREQPYTRRLVVGEEPMELDCGWVENPEWVMVQNRTGVGLQVQPTPEEAAAIAAAVVVLALAGSDTGITIAPGRGQPVPLEDVSRWRLRCRKGTAKVTIYVFPR
jgi:hypothetical protein